MIIGNRQTIVKWRSFRGTRLLDLGIFEIGFLMSAAPVTQPVRVRLEPLGSGSPVEGLSIDSMVTVKWGSRRHKTRIQVSGSLDQFLWVYL